MKIDLKFLKSIKLENTGRSNILHLFWSNNVIITSFAVFASDFVFHIQHVMSSAIPEKGCPWTKRNRETGKIPGMESTVGVARTTKCVGGGRLIISNTENI